MRRSGSSISSSQDSKEKLMVFRRNSQSPLGETYLCGDDGVGFPCVSLQGHGVSSPPVQGRSVREFEEQMASLRKENFNLKLRLYFLEESVPGYHQSNAEGPESLMKQLIDTKVEIEILRKELEEKQDLLKEAAQAMNHMEQIQKETETKGQAFIDELKQKIQFLEMERDLDKTHHSGFMNDLLGHSDISENVNALQKIRELEGMVTQCEGKMHALQMQNSKLEEIIAKRDEAIKEYEEKVKELAFQNAELLETMENKEKEMATAESAICTKTANTARLLERIQDYEKRVTKMSFERNLAKRENRFFRAIIGKLQRSKNEYFTIEKEEIYQQYGHEFDEKPIDCNKHYEMNYRDMLKARGDFHGEYLLKQKLCVNYSNNSAKYNKVEKCEHDMPESSTIVKRCYLHDGCSHHRGAGVSSGGASDYEPEFPIRYTISDDSMFAGGGCVDGPCTSRSNSCTSLQANISNASIYCGAKETSPVREPEYAQNQWHSQLSNVDGVRFVYSKFGHFQ